MTEFDVVEKALNRAWHGNGCATNVGPEDGGGYCTPGCVVYESKHAFTTIRSQHEADQARIAELEEERDGYLRAQTVFHIAAAADKKLVEAGRALRDAAATMLDHLRFHGWKDDPNSDRRYEAVKNAQEAIATYDATTPGDHWGGCSGDEDCCCPAGRTPKLAPTTEEGA